MSLGGRIGDDSQFEAFFFSPKMIAVDFDLDNITANSESSTCSAVGLVVSGRLFF